MHTVPILRPDPIIPRSAFHAAQLELDGKGSMKAIGSTIQYIDPGTNVVSATWRYEDNREARLQLDFFKKSANDLRTNRQQFRVIQGGKA